MIKNIYSVFDKKAQLFCAPFYSVNDQTALRDFTRAANDQDSDINRYSLDYSLYYIGSFDDESGHISTDVQRRHVADAFQLVAPPEVSQNALSDDPPIQPRAVG